MHLITIRFSTSLFLLTISGSSGLIPLTSLFDNEKSIGDSFQATSTGPNEQKVEDIFSLLADFEDLSKQQDSVSKTDPFREPMTRPPLSDPTNQVNEDDFDPYYKVEEYQDPPGSQEEPFYEDLLSMANSWSKTIVVATDVVEDLINTVDKVSKIYEEQKEKMLRQAPGNKTDSVGGSSRPASLVDALLDPDTVENALEIGMRSQDEDEILQHLSNLIIGAEDRSGGYGGGLTLDPVTIIALLTLAAYLIRAVYQILVVTGRSLDHDMGIPLGLSDLPEAMVSLHNMLSPTDIVVDRHRRELKERGEKGISSPVLVGDVAALIMLHRAGQEGCVRRFLCEQLVGRDIQYIGISEATIAGMGILYGDPNTLRYLDERDEGGTCSRASSSCGDNRWSSGKNSCSCSDLALQKAKKLQSIYATIAEGVSRTGPVFKKWVADLGIRI